MREGDKYNGCVHFCQTLLTVADFTVLLQILMIQNRSMDFAETFQLCSKDDLAR